MPHGVNDWGQYQTYGALMADAGLAGVVFNHGLNSIDSYQKAKSNAILAVKSVRENAARYSIDKDRICLWFFSGGGNFVAPFLEERPEWLRCVVIYDGALGPDVGDSMGFTFTETQAAGLDPFPLLQSKNDWDPAFFIAEAGGDNKALNAGFPRALWLIIGK